MPTALSTIHRWAGYIVTMRRGLASWRIIASSTRPDKLTPFVLVEEMTSGALELWKLSDLEDVLRRGLVQLRCDAVPRLSEMTQSQMRLLVNGPGSVCPPALADTGYGPPVIYDRPRNADTSPATNSITPDSVSMDPMADPISDGLPAMAAAITV